MTHCGRRRAIVHDSYTRQREGEDEDADAAAEDMNILMLHATAERAGSHTHTHTHTHIWQAAQAIELSSITEESVLSADSL